MTHIRKSESNVETSGKPPGRHKLVLCFAALLSLYCVLWAITHLFGRATAEAALHEEILRGDETALNGFRRVVAYDSTDGPGLIEEAPWYFIGNSSSPAPLMVGVDVAHVDKNFGSSGRVYYWWFFGIRSRLEHKCQFLKPLSTAITSHIMLWWTLKLSISHKKMITFQVFYF